MSDSRFEVVRDDMLGESVWLATSRNGLRLRVVPNHDFREVVAAITFAYGSTDLGFDVDGQRHDSPEGVAHYLEHKLFEDQELAIFDRFAAGRFSGRMPGISCRRVFGRKPYRATITVARGLAINGDTDPKNPLFCKIKATPFFIRRVNINCSN